MDLGSTSRMPPIQDAILLRACQESCTGTKGSCGRVVRVAGFLVPGQLPVAQSHPRPYARVLMLALMSSKPMTCSLTLRRDAPVYIRVRLLRYPTVAARPDLAVCSRGTVGSQIGAGP